jgi:hypothetical protein
MIKKIAAVTVLIMVAALSVAGCTVTNTGNTSPTETQSPSPLYQVKTTTTNATSNAITDSYAKGGYDILKQFIKGTNQYGNDVYIGVVRDNSSSHVTPYEHNITIEIIKSKNETVTRAAQLREIYVKQGYYMPGNLSSGLISYSNSNDPTGTHQLMIGLCDPNIGCISNFTINRFMIIVDTQTKLG